MPIAITELVSAWNNADQSTAYTQSVTTTANDALLVVPYLTRHGTTSPGFTASGGSLSWVESIAEQIDGITGVGASAVHAPTAGTFTLSLTPDGGVTAIGCGYSVMQVFGHDLSAPIADTALGTTGNNAATSATITMNALKDPNNAQIAFFAHRTNETQTPEGSPWVAGTQRNGAGPNTGLGAHWLIAGSDLTATSSWATSARWQGLALEIAVAPAAGPTQLYVPLARRPHLGQMTGRA